MNFIDVAMSSCYRMQPYVGTYVVEQNFQQWKKLIRQSNIYMERQSRTAITISFSHLCKYQKMRFVGFFRAK